MNLKYFEAIPTTGTNFLTISKSIKINIMKANKMTNYQINESLNLLCELSNRITNDYLHIKDCVPDILKTIDFKISALYKELEKRQSEN